MNNLLLLAKQYAEHRGLTLSTVSSYAANDGKFFGRIEKGAGCTVRTAERLMLWFSENWPADLDWPADIARPDPVASKRKAS